MRVDLTVPCSCQCVPGCVFCSVTFLFFIDFFFFLCVSEYSITFPLASIFFVCFHVGVGPTAPFSCQCVLVCVFRSVTLLFSCQVCGSLIIYPKLSLLSLQL